MHVINVDKIKEQEMKDIVASKQKRRLNLVLNSKHNVKNEI